MRNTLPKLPHVKYVRARGRTYAYFNTGKQTSDGKPILNRLPDPASADFYGSYSAMAGARTKREAAASVYTVSSLIDAYLASTEFADLADKSRKAYRLHLGDVRKYLGKAPVDDLTAADIRAVLDAKAWNPGKRNMVVAVIGALYKWGRERQKATISPTKDIARAKGGTHLPWPDDVLEAALKADDATVRLAVHVLYFTGLRLNDARALRWGDIRDSVVRVTPSKTSRYNKRLDIPLAAELKVELASTPKTGMTVIPRISEQNLRDRLKAFCAEHGVQRVPHGLRKNAVNSLLLAGCTVPEVAAITGQTHQIVEHYAAQINRRKLGEGAIVKLDLARRG